LYSSHRHINFVLVLHTSNIYKDATQHIHKQQAGKQHTPTTKQQQPNNNNTVISQLKDKEFKYQEQTPKPTNWTNYDLAQTSEINDMLPLIHDIVNQAAYNLDLPNTTDHKGPGRPKHSPVDGAKIVLMAQYFGLSNRGAQGYMQLFKEKLGFTTVYSYKTIERAYSTMEVRQILEEVFELTNVPVKDLEHEFGPDATGHATSCKQNYETDRAKDQTSKGYEKALYMVGLKYKVIAAFIFASRSSDHESPYFEKLLRDTARRYGRLDLVGGDAAYLSRRNCALVAVLGATPRFYPKKGTTLRQKGSVAWRRMLEDLVLDPQKWLKDYHKRSNVEGCFSTLKRDNPLPLRKKLGERKQQEAFTRACNLNIKRLCYLNYLEDINARDSWHK
jgi:transposase